MDFKLDSEIYKRPTKTIYRDGDKLIKLFDENYSKADILNEALNQARVEESTDLLVPKLLQVSTINGKWAIVSEFVEGKTLKELMQENPDKIDEYLDLFVDIQLEVLSKKVPLLTMTCDKFKRKLNNCGNIDESTRFELMHRLEGMKRHTKLCHGDFNPSNIIITSDKKHYIIDWSHATQGNASADCAKTFLIFSLNAKREFAEKYLDLFAKKSGIEKSNLLRWIPIVAAAQLEKCNSKEREMLLKWTNVVDYD